MACVVIEKLTKTFKGPKGEDLRAVCGLSLRVEDGEFLVLVGPSGCGKSTTLRLIAGLEEVTDGTIAIDNVMVNRMAPKDRDLAMVFQNHALYPHMTAHENLAFGLKLRKFPRDEIARRVSEAAEMLGLEDCLDRKPAALSGGQRQRVAVGRAIVRKPRVFLFDEPLSNLDAQMRAQMRREISRLHTRLGATMIYVTHDQVEAMTMGDRIAVMKDGQLQQVAGPMELYHQPANLFTAGFIGSPPMNLFRGRLVQNGAGVVFVQEAPPGGHVGFSIPMPDEIAARLEGRAGKPIVLGLRPEHITGGQPNANGTPVVKATVESVEPMGSETYIYSSAGAHSFAARFPAGYQAKPGQQVSLALDLRGARFFDPATEQAVAA